MADQNRTTYWVFEESLLGKLIQYCGWVLGWVCFFLVRVGLTRTSSKLVDSAIMMRRGNPGAIRTVGYLNGLDGILAVRRGRLVIEGRTHSSSPFADRHFIATYDVAARSVDRALDLIRRWEWDAIPESIKVIDGNLDEPDPGAEGILWVSNGRTFYSDEADSHTIA